MCLNDWIEILEPHLSPYGSDGKSTLEINAVSQLSPFGEQFPELLRDQFLAPEKPEMGRQFSSLKSQLFAECLIAYEVAVWLPGDPNQTTTD